MICKTNTCVCICGKDTPCKVSELMTKEIKIRCDDCKFVENCVDYGWDGCRKFTPKPSEPLTNEEWLRQASTEDVAKWLSKISKFFHECGKRDVFPKIMYEEDWEWWLKEIHHDGDT